MKKYIPTICYCLIILVIIVLINIHVLSSLDASKTSSVEDKYIIESVTVDSITCHKSSFENIPYSRYDIYHYSVDVVGVLDDNKSTISIKTKADNLDKWIGDTILIKHGYVKLN